jgi:hypothetical protein
MIGNKNPEIRNAISTLVLCAGIQGVFIATYVVFGQIERSEKPSLAALLFSVAALVLSIVIFMMMRLRRKTSGT